MPASTGKKGGKKFDRCKNKPCHKRYNAENRREKNLIVKARRIAKLMKKFCKYKPFNITPSLSRMVVDIAG